MKLLSSLDNDISLAAEALKQGSLVAFPTETVYGLGADAFNVKALAKIFEAKQRPYFDPLIIHIAEINAFDRLVSWELLDKKAKADFDLLVKTFWPGPLTLVLPKHPELPGLVNSGLSTVAVRFPANEIAQKLIRHSTGAIAAPSANPFGCLSPTRAEHVVSMLGDKVDFIVDGGRTGIGLESTVLDISARPYSLLRPGGISCEQIEALIGSVENNTGQLKNHYAPKSPGQLKNHYAPSTPLYLHKPNELANLPLLPNEGRLYFCEPGSGNAGNSNYADNADNAGDRIKVLSKHGDLIEAAANLFDMLHKLDSLGLELIHAEQVPAQGLGIAINDRLCRAAFKN